VAVLEQLVVDDRQPVALARLWAAALERFEIRSYGDAQIARLAPVGRTPENDPCVVVDVPRPVLEFEVVAECSDGSEAVGAARASSPDLVLMDVRMPRDGVTATRQLRATMPDMPVLTLTTFDDDEALAGMLRAGAAGFVLKRVPAEGLQHAVRSVAEGGAWLDPAATRRVLDGSHHDPGDASRVTPRRGSFDTRSLTV